MAVLATSVGSIKLPIFTEYNGNRIEIGELEVPITVNLDIKAPGPVMRGRE